MRIAGFLCMLLMAIVDPLYNAFRAAMRATSVGAPPLARLIKFSEHPFVKRGHANAYAGCGGLRSFFAGIPAQAFAVALVVLMVCASAALGHDPSRGMLLAGLAGQTVDMSEVKSLIETQGRLFEEFKNANDARFKQIENKGAPDAEVTAKVDALNTALAETQAKLRDIETIANRPGNESDAEKVKAKALTAGFFNLMRNKAHLVPAEVRAALIEDATGEILVPEDVEAGIRRVRGRANVMRTLASVRSTTSDRVRRRSLTELAVGWGKLEVGASLVETTPTPTEAYVYVEDLYGLIRIGEDELADTDDNLTQYVDDSFGRAIGDKEETGFVLGLGHGSSQPEGFTLGSTVARVDALQAGAITADDLLNLQFAVDASYANSPDAAYLVGRTTELAMRKFKDGNDQYLWQPSMAAGSPPTFAGKPVYNSSDLVNIPDVGDTADVAAFGDWKTGYQIVDRLGVAVKRLNELYATAGMVGFLAHARVTGYVSDAAALRILSVPEA